MIIGDEELRGLYASECEEHLQSLDEGLLRLENAPADSAIVERLFRAAHSLKGSSRMVGVTGAEIIAHAMEDTLGGAKRARTALSADDVERLNIGLNALRRLVKEAVEGAPSNLNVAQTLGEMASTNASSDSPPESSTRNDSSANENTQHARAQVARIPADQSSITPPLTAPTASAPTASAPNLNSQNSSAANAATQSSAVQSPMMPDAAHDSAAQNDATRFAPLVSAPLISAPTILAVRDETPAVSQSKNAISAAATSANKTSANATSSGASSRGASSPTLASDDFKIQTMRVAPARLDALMTLASELAVTTTRVSRGLSALDEIGTLCDRWSRDLAQRNRQMAREKTVGDAERAHQFAALRSEEARLAQLQHLWSQFRAVVPKNAARLGAVAEDIEESIRSVRLLPLSTVFNFFPRLVRDLARAQGKDVHFTIEGGDTPADKRVLEEIKDPLMHMLRNAIDHGIETPDERAQNGKPRAATLRLRAQRGAAELTIQISDDGRGLNEDAIADVALKRGLHAREELEAMSREQIQMLIFAPGFSTSAVVTDVSGRGVGMDVVRHNIENLKGTLSTHSVRGRGCIFTIRLPLTLSTTRVLLVEADAQTYALPVESVCGLVRLRRAQLFSWDGRPAWIQNNEAISIVPLTQLLELPPASAISSTRNDMDDVVSCVILEVGGEKIGLQVDCFWDEQEVVWKSLGPLLKRVRNVAGTTILGSGAVCMVLNAHDLVRSSQSPKRRTTARDNAMLSEIARKTVLLVEDSITTRTQEKRVLESAGYEVVTAVDGRDGLAKLAARAFDAVVSDVEMPNLSGLEMAAKIREDASLREMPIILVTTLASDDDKRRGMEVGADAYLAKSAFEQKELLDTLSRLIP